MINVIRNSKTLRHLYASSLGQEILQQEREASRALDVAAISAMVKNHVPVDASVIVPPQMTGFRILALRSPFVLYKDRGPAEFDEAFATDWYDRMNAIHAIIRKGNETQWRIDNSLPLEPSEVLMLHKKYAYIKLDYLLTTKKYCFPIMGTSCQYVLYRIVPMPSIVSRPPRPVPPQPSYGLLPRPWAPHLDSILLVLPSRSPWTSN
jgi:hypothetical protein